jgi:hypothetical protein
MRGCFSSLFALLVVLSTPAFAGDEPSVLTRKGWNAGPVTQPMKPQKPIAILVHHTATPMKLKTRLATKMRRLQRFSQAKEKLADGRMKAAWPDVPYHFYIGADGKIAEGRSITAVGDTNTGYDPTGFIQVVVEGNFEKETVTSAQEASLKQLLSWLKGKYSIGNGAILGHADKAQTECPGKDLAARLPKIIADLK